MDTLTEIRPWLFLLPRDVWLKSDTVGIKFCLWDNPPGLEVCVDIATLYRESSSSNATVLTTATLHFSYQRFASKSAVADVNAEIQERAVEMLKQADTFINIGKGTI